MKILIPVDGSPHAAAALDFVASRSTLLGQAPAVVLVNVQPALSARITRAVGRDEAKAYQRAQADEVLRPALDRLKRAGIAARASYALGTRSDVIGAVAVRGRADLIVMGSRGHSGLQGLLFGSTTNAVLAGCTKPLLVLRSDKVPPHDCLAVGIAVDGSRHSVAAVRWAIRHRALFGADPRFELIHVDDGNASPADLDKAMAAPLKRLSAAGLAARPVGLVGSAAGDAIAAHARRRRLDLLVMGSHGRGAFKSLVLGSVSQRVAARCDTPLLLIREPAAARG